MPRSVPIHWRPGRRAILLLAALACLLSLLAHRIVRSETAVRHLEVAHRHAALADRLGEQLEDRMMAREGALLEELTVQGADREAIVSRIRALPPSASWAQPILLLANDGSVLGGTGKMGGALARAPLAGRRTNRGDRFRWLLRDVQQRRRNRRDGREQPLTDREVALLTLLIAAPGEVIRRDRLLDEIWGYEASATTRTVDTFVYRLRQKIEAQPSRPRYLITVRGAGYKYVP